MMVSRHQAVLETVRKNGESVHLGGDLFMPVMLPVSLPSRDRGSETAQAAGELLYRVLRAALQEKP